MSIEKTRGIWIITDETTTVSDTDGGKSGTDIGADYTQPATDTKPGKKQTRIKAEDLKQNVTEFLEVVEEAFDQAEKPSSKIQLDELELSVEINGKGKVSLLGTGGEAGASGAIKLKFKRKDG
ncbi:MAG: hypothetical protein AB4426_17750 [Xenococcaceae cyanobacterium]